MRIAGLLLGVVLAGCLGSPAERTCADYPRDTPACADYWAEADGAAVDGARGDAGGVEDMAAVPDVGVDGGSADVGEAPDLAARCEPGAVEVCEADGFCAGRRVCLDDGSWSACVPDDPVDEVCNGADDDCDGAVDELAARSCGLDVGRCVEGAEACVDGAWVCEGAVEPGEEACDGSVDEDCDGSVDEGCPCQADTVEPCGASEVGACAFGERVCEGEAWGACVGAVAPGDELCNGADDDCDGVVDEGLSMGCGSATGACEQGQQVCVDGAWGACEGGVAPVDEACNGVDDDCDGAADEGVVEVCGSDVGACELGGRRCVGGVFDACDAAVVPGAQGEVCEGSVDEDCDGSVDEACECSDGEQVPCGLDVGRCAPGEQTCVGGALGPCVGAVEPRPERCDTVDDDCDGAVDEGLGLGEACAVGEGICRREGAVVCLEEGPGCDARPGSPGVEACDGRDEDCDGLVDEALPLLAVDESRVAQFAVGERLGVGPAAARFDGLTGMAWTVDGGFPMPVGERLMFRVFDEAGQPTGPPLTLAAQLNDVTALGVATFEVDGSGGFVVFAAHRVRNDVIEADRQHIQLWVVHAGRGAVEPGDSRVLDAPVVMSTITGLAVASNAQGVALAFAGPDDRDVLQLTHGFIPFAVEPPTFTEAVTIEDADAPALVWGGERFVLAYRLTVPMRRGATIEVVSVGQRLVEPVVVDDGVSLGAPSLAMGGGVVMVAWQAPGGDGPGVYVSELDLRASTRTPPLLVSGRAALATAPSVAVDGRGVGVAWVDLREGEDESEVWYARLWRPGRDWAVSGVLRLSNASGPSEPVVLLGGSTMTAVWGDARPIGRGVYLSAGGLGCPGADSRGEAVE